MEANEHGTVLNGHAAVNPRTYSEPFLDLDLARARVDSDRKALARSEAAERAARAAVLEVLRRAGGPVAYGSTLYTPTYASARGEMVDFREARFTWASELPPGGKCIGLAESPASEPVNTAFTGPISAEVLAECREAAGRPVPEPDPEPAFGVAPRETVRELVRRGRPLEAAVFDDDGEC